MSSYTRDTAAAYTNEDILHAGAEELGITVGDILAQPDSYVLDYDLARVLAHGEHYEEQWQYGADAASWSASYEAAEAELDAYDEVSL